MRLLMFESINLLFQRSWLAIFPVLIIITFFNIDNVRWNAYGHHLTANIWDGPASVLFDANYFLFAVVLMFVVIVGSSLIRDMDTGYQMVVLTRTRRISWLNAKIGAIFFSAVVYVFMVLLVMLVFSAFFLPWEFSFSQFATSNSLSQRYFYHFSSAVSPLSFFAALWVYTAFAFTVFMLIPLVLSLMTRHKQVAMIIPLVMLILTRLGWAFLPYSYLQYDLGTRLAFTIHYTPMAAVPFTLSSSLIYLGVVCLVSWLIGVFLVRRSDF